MLLKEIIKIINVYDRKKKMLINTINNFNKQFGYVL